MTDCIISVTALGYVWGNKQYMCALEDFMHTHPKRAMAVHLRFSVCVYISVHASLNIHYLPHYNCSFTTANTNCSSNATRCVCVFLHTSVLVHAMS